MDGMVKIGDFGLVTSVAKENLTEPECMHTKNRGTKLYMSPEQVCIKTFSNYLPVIIRLQLTSLELRFVIDKSTFVFQENGSTSYTNKIDIYALGVIFVELCVPFKTEKERIETLKELHELVFPQLLVNDLPKEVPF